MAFYSQMGQIMGAKLESLGEQQARQGSGSAAARPTATPAGPLPPSPPPPPPPARPPAGSGVRLRQLDDDEDDAGAVLGKKDGELPPLVPPAPARRPVVIQEAS